MDTWLIGESIPDLCIGCLAIHVDWTETNSRNPQPLEWSAAQPMQRHGNSHLAEVSAAPSTRGRRCDQGRLELVRLHSQTQTPTCWLPLLLLRSNRASLVALHSPGSSQACTWTVCQEMTHSAHTCIKRNNLLSCSMAFNQSPATSERRPHFVLLILTSIDRWAVFFLLFNLVYFKAMEMFGLWMLNYFVIAFTMQLLKANPCQPVSVLGIRHIGLLITIKDFIFTMKYDQIISNIEHLK